MSDKLREAAQAALDAMKLARGNHGKIMLAYPAIESWLYHRVDQRLDDAITDVEDALAEPKQEPVVHPFEDSAVISALTWAASLIEKKYPVGHNGGDSWLMNYSDKHGEHIRRSDHREWEKVHGRWKPKAAPPRREWVGLTDEEIDAIYLQHHNRYDQCESPNWSYERAVEAKLRERNGG